MIPLGQYRPICHRFTAQYRINMTKYHKISRRNNPLVFFYTKSAKRPRTKIIKSEPFAITIASAIGSHGYDTGCS